MITLYITILLIHKWYIIYNPLMITLCIPKASKIVRPLAEAHPKVKKFRGPMRSHEVPWGTPNLGNWLLGCFKLWIAALPLAQPILAWPSPGLGSVKPLVFITGVYGFRAGMSAQFPLWGKICPIINIIFNWYLSSVLRDTVDLWHDRAIRPKMPMKLSAESKVDILGLRRVLYTSCAVCQKKCNFGKRSQQRRPGTFNPAFKPCEWRCA